MTPSATLIRFKCACRKVVLFGVRAGSKPAQTLLSGFIIMQKDGDLRSNHVHGQEPGTIEVLINGDLWSDRVHGQETGMIEGWRPAVRLRAPSGARHDRSLKGWRPAVRLRAPSGARHDPISSQETCGQIACTVRRPARSKVIGRADCRIYLKIRFSLKTECARVWLLLDSQHR